MKGGTPISVVGTRLITTVLDYKVKLHTAYSVTLFHFLFFCNWCCKLLVAFGLIMAESVTKCVHCLTEVAED